MPYRDPLRIALQQPRIPLVLLTHPVELAVGAVLMINGLRGFAGDISPSLATLPQWLQMVYLAVSTVGGTGVVTGLLARVPDGVVALAVERASLFLVAAAWLALSAVILKANGTGGMGIALTLAVIAGACLLRARAIKLAARVILRTLTVVNREARK